MVVVVLPRKTRMQRFTLMLLVTMMQCCGATAIAQSTKTILDQPLDQQASVKKILSLGGDWEAPSKTVLIGFIGAKFTNETFELLKPLSEMRILYLSDIPADDKAFEHCKGLEALEEIQIRDCKFDGSGLKHLAKCKRLKRVIIADTPVNDECLEIISHCESLEYLSIENFDIASEVTQADRRRGKRYSAGLLDLFLPANSPGVLHQNFGQGSNRLTLFSVLDLIDLVAARSNRFKVLANRLAMAHRDRFGLQGGFA